MKKILTLLSAAVLIFHWPVKGQVITETVDFDAYLSVSDNDFVNHFDGGLGLNQIQANGITGGCLETPQTVNWGNDNAKYCTRIRAQIGDTCTVSICYKYDTLQLNSINFDRAASLWLVPFRDPNHYAIASMLDS